MKKLSYFLVNNLTIIHETRYQKKNKIIPDMTKVRIMPIISGTTEKSSKNSVKNLIIIKGCIVSDSISWIIFAGLQPWVHNTALAE